MKKNKKNFAYEDKERTIPIFPDNPNILDYAGKALYCQNPNCPARMFIRKADKPEEAYFQASGKPAHIGDCGMIGAKGFKKEDYDEAAFHYLDALQALEIPCTQKAPTPTNCPPNESRSEITQSLKVLHTLKQIHTMASHMAPEDSFGDIVIKDLIVDKRTLPLYTDGIDGYKIVECKLHQYTNSGCEHSVLMNYSFEESEPQLVKLKFEDKQLFETLLPILYHSKDNALAVIAANFCKTNLPFGKTYIKSECTIYSKRQVAVYK